MDKLIASPTFGILLSLVAFEVSNLLFKKTKLAILNPLLVAIILIIVILSKLNINYDDYNQGGQYISFFLYPATVALALPVYKKLTILKDNLKIILISNFIGQLIGIITILFLSRLFGLSDQMIKSIVPKSITTPLGMAVSVQLGGITSITVAAIILTGIIGATLSPFLVRIFKNDDKIATGLAIGAASHAVGTAKAIEIGEIEGSMSGISMVISGIIIVIFAPVLFSFYIMILY